MVISFNRQLEGDVVFVELFHGWWGLHNNHSISDDFLSDFGFVAFCYNRPILISFLYPIIGCKTALWGFQVVSPDSNKQERKKAFSEMSTFVCRFANDLGYSLLMAYPGPDVLRNRLIKCGFSQGEKSTQMLRRV